MTILRSTHFTSASGREYVIDDAGRATPVEAHDEPHEPTCWVCDGYHHGRGCPVDAHEAMDAYDDRLGW